MQLNVRADTALAAKLCETHRYPNRKKKPEMDLSYGIWPFITRLTLTDVLMVLICKIAKIATAKITGGNNISNEQNRNCGPYGVMYE